MPGLGHLADAEKRRGLRNEIEDLREEIEGAKRFHDSGRAELVQQTLEILLNEDRKVRGLKGTPRKASGPEESVRVTVYEALRAARGRLRKEIPALAAHLADSLTTGTFCSYSPSPPITWTLF